MQALTELAIIWAAVFVAVVAARATRLTPVLFFLFLGFEESTSNFMSSIRKSWGIASFGALAPFFVAYFVADFY